MNTFNIFILIALACFICALCLLISVAWKAGKEEQKEPDIEEEIDKVYLKNRIVGKTQGAGDILLGREAFARIAYHFAKWGAEHLKK